MGFWDGHAERVNHYATSIRIFRPSKFFSRKKIRGSEIKDIMWFNPGGYRVPEMEDEEWNTAFVRSLGVHAERGYDVCDFEIVVGSTTIRS